jgi:SAM-dependent methyltransferase
MDGVMARRARRLAARLAPHLPACGRGLDVGCGTGHTAAALGPLNALVWTGADVTDLHVTGPAPVRFDGARLPFAGGTFDCALLLFVLQYAPAPAALLCESARVTRGPMVVIQSTVAGAAGQAALRANELLWGPLAFAAARGLGWIRAREFTLGARNYFTRRELHAVFGEAGLAIAHWEPCAWRGLPVSHDLYVLRGAAWNTRRFR